MLETTLADLRSETERQKAEMGQMVSAQEDLHNASLVFFGLVDGGSEGMIQLYEEMPGPGDSAPPKPIATMKQGRWVRMVYPKYHVDHTSRSSGTDHRVASTWYCAQIIDAKTADMRILYVPDRNATGDPSFSRFDTYNRSL